MSFDYYSYLLYVKMTTPEERRRDDEEFWRVLPIVILLLAALGWFVIFWKITQ